MPIRTNTGHYAVTTHDPDRTWFFTPNHNGHVWEHDPVSGDVIARPQEPHPMVRCTTCHEEYCAHCETNRLIRPCPFPTLDESQLEPISSETGEFD